MRVLERSELDDYFRGLLDEGPETGKVFFREFEWGTSTSYHACGNPDCCVSTGIHEGPTYGRGKLDYYGYWEFPCDACARQREKVEPGVQAWPFKAMGGGE